MKMPTVEEVEEFIVYLGKQGHGQSIVLLRQFADLLRLLQGQATGMTTVAELDARLAGFEEMRDYALLLESAMLAARPK